MKLLILGKEGVGKTTIASALTKKKKPHGKDGVLLSTEGVDITNWNPKSSVKFSLFDFAGQEVFYPTHQFFLSPKSLYLVVFDVSKRDYSSIEYWLQLIQSISYKKSPVILIGTHIDSVSMLERKEITEKINREFVGPYSNIEAFVLINAKSKDDLHALKSQILPIADKHVRKKLIPGCFVQ
jgi:leucine-rich repeat kinase 2